MTMQSIDLLFISSKCLYLLVGHKVLSERILCQHAKIVQAYLGLSLDSADVVLNGHRNLCGFQFNANRCGSLSEWRSADVLAVTSMHALPVVYFAQLD
eukprot:2692066-Amphidinium_carterae.1